MRTRILAVAAGLAVTPLFVGSLANATQSTTPSTPAAEPAAPADGDVLAALNQRLGTDNGLCAMVTADLIGGIRLGWSSDDDLKQRSLAMLSPMFGVLAKDAAANPPAGFPAELVPSIQKLSAVYDQVVAELSANGVSDEVIGRLARGDVDFNAAIGGPITSFTLPDLTGFTIPDFSAMTIPGLSIPQITMPDLGPFAELMKQFGSVQLGTPGATLDAADQAALDAAIDKLTIVIDEERDAAYEGTEDVADGLKIGTICPALAVFDAMNEDDEDIVISGSTPMITLP